MKTSKAFTLIEIMVVVSIIGTLSSTILAGLVNAREKAIVASAVKFENYNDRLLAIDTYVKYTFDGADPLADSSGNNNVASKILCNSCDIDTATPHASGFSYNFTGTGALAASLVGTPSTITDYTMSVWVYPTTWTIQQGVGVGNAAGGEIATLGNGGPTLVKLKAISSSVILSQGADTITAGVSLPLNKWSLITVTNSYANNSATIYINGVEKIRQTALTFSLPGPHAVILNSISYPGGQEFYGNFDDFTIYGQSLTAKQIQKMYARESKKYVDLALTQSE